MYLKSIEMQGFKSFADKTKVVFDQGVTAVVGPNGSGKSNITESLRWALGESSAKSLRGGKMPDVIFAGTEKRKPLNYASVVVTLDNSNAYIANRAKEIRVERQIYRSGESEYLIDGQKVRLRDIHDLFMDTGLGRDSFSIISQGRVESIFNSKPEERRAIFEEAAGVLKYKTRKKETESKLSQTQDNLDRLEDILYELETQVKPLKKQAETARRFVGLEEQRKALFLDVLVGKIQTGHTFVKEQETALEEIKEELSTYYRQREELEVANQALKKKRHDLSDAIEVEQGQLLDLTRLISDYERQIEVHHLESSQHASSKQDAQERLQVLEERLHSLREEGQEKAAEINRLQEKVAHLQESLTQTAAEIDRFSEDPNQVIEHLREQYVALLQKEAEASNALTKVEQDRDHQLRLSQNQTAEMERLEGEKQVAEQESQASHQRLEEAQQTLRKLAGEFREWEALREQTEADYRREQGKMFDLLDDIKNKQARQSSLDAILKNHSNFYAGVKAVLQASQSLGGIVGAVSEHLTFDAQYQTALEIALGGASQHIIVEDEAAAKAGIAFLRKNRQGRATFLPLTTIKARRLSPQHQATLEQAPGFLGTADQLVSYEDRLGGIFQNLLGATAIFESIDQANQAARKVRFQVRMVTLDGSEIRAGGAFAGGANRNQTTTFIKPELEALKKEVTLLQGQLDLQEKQVAGFKATLEGHRHKTTQLQASGEAARLEEQKAALFHQQQTERLADVTRLYELQVQQLGNGQLTGLESLAADLRQQLQDFEREKAALTQQIEEVKSNRGAIQERLEALRSKHSQLAIEEGQKKGELRFAQTEASRLQSEIDQAEKEKQLLQERIAQKEQALDATSLEELEKQLAQATQRKEASQQALVRFKFEVEDIEGQVEDLEERLEKIRVTNDDRIRRQAKLEADYEQARRSLQGLLVSLAEQYKLSFEEAVAKVSVLEDLEQAEREVKDLERAIRSLGPVNIDAIDQYEEVSQRLEFLSQQREDVLSARDLLLSTIHEMDDEVKARFKTTFEAIRQSFQTTFKQIFGGGSADLLLTSTDLLTAGVDISVQPPGKKIQSLNLMSGGEKALSALALLFSIIRVKTIPFVILDEVEAALDEANVKRFGEYLNRFDKSSQFIVVTHRKGTMAAADAIYGVTMQESGVSRIVSVKLKDVEDDFQ